MLSLLRGRGTWGLEHGTFLREIFQQTADNVPSLMGKGNMGPGTWITVFMREIVPADNVPISCGAMEHGVRN